MTSLGFSGFGDDLFSPEPFHGEIEKRDYPYLLVIIELPQLDLSALLCW